MSSYIKNRFDVVGSYLRPQNLKLAREKFATNEISFEELKKVEDESIKYLVEKQKELGLEIFTDGEFRRATWHLDFMWSFDGVGHKKTETGIPFKDVVALIDDTYLTDRISLKGIHPFVEHFKYIKQFEDENFKAKQTIPAPAQFLQQMILPINLADTLKIYGNIEDLIEDIVKGYKKVIKDLYEAGCRNIQFDDCTWGVLVDPRVEFILGTDRAGVEKIKEQLLRVNNLVIEDKPADLLINTHVCRGNFKSTWACEGAYDDIAKELFEKENVYAYYLEFDDERSGSFEPLKYLSEDKIVVLGIVSTKKSKLENKEYLINRIKEASKYIPIDRIYLGTQCGFASCEEGNNLVENDQWEKIKLIKEVAKEVFSGI